MTVASFWGTPSSEVSITARLRGTAWTGRVGRGFTRISGAAGAPADWWEAFYPISSTTPMMVLDYANDQYVVDLAGSGLVEKTFKELHTTTRASGATQVVDGLVVSAAHAYTTRSEQLNFGDWSNFNISITANDAVSPDGETSADKVIATTANNAHYMNGQNHNFVQGTLYKLSCYFNKADITYMGLWFGGGAMPASEREAVFNLNTGVVSYVQTNITAKIVDAGGGWWLCSIEREATSSAANTTGIVLSDDGVLPSSYAGDGTSGGHAFGFHLRQLPMGPSHDFADTYVQAFADPVQQVRIGDTGILMEPVATNICLRSEELGTVWGGSATVTSDDSIAPNGLIKADKVADTSAVATQNKSQSIAVSDDSAKYTLSCYVLKDAITSRFPEFLVRFGGGTQRDFRTRINTLTGALDTSLATTPMVVSSELRGLYWFIRVTVDNNSTGNTNLSIFFQPAIAATIDGAADVTIQGDITVWGVDCKVGAGLSSYIPTAGVAVTRAAETATLLTDQFDYVNTDWSMASEVIVDDLTAALSKYVYTFTGTGGLSATAFYKTDGKASFFAGVGGDVTFGTASPRAVPTKIAVRFAVNDLNITVDGGTPVEDAVVTGATLITTMSIGNRLSDGLRALDGTIAFISYWKVGLIDADIVGLST